MRRAGRVEDARRRTLDELAGALVGARLGKAATAAFPDGHSAFALVHHVLGRALPRYEHAARARHHLDRAIDALARAPMAPWLHGGFTGVGWVCAYVSEGGEDGNEAIDEALGVLLNHRRWPLPYDLITGLVGYGVYALERLPRGSSVALLERIVGHLAATAKPQPVGLSWKSRPAWVPDALRTRFDGGFNLGLAHGVPGVIALLGRVWRAGIARAETSRLLEGAVAWLLAQELPRRSVSAFSTHILKGEAPAPARAAWCYGDPGVAAALLIAARASGETSWRRAAVRIGARAAMRDPDSAGVADAGLCHGAAGLAHIFRRLHAATEDPRFAEAAESWLARTLAMREPGRGVGGYLSMTGTMSKPLRARDPSFLTGTAGIAVALASFSAEPDADDWCGWDRVLLLSDRPKPPVPA